MNGATSTTSVAASLHLPPKNSTLLASSGDRRTNRKAADPWDEGALATAEAAVSRSLGESGFVDITESVTQSLTVSRDFPPAQDEVGDLKPGALESLISLVKEQMSVDAELSVQGQAHVRPDVAVTLLT